MRCSVLFFMLASTLLCACAAHSSGPAPATGPPPVVQEQLPTVLLAALPRSEGLNGEALERGVLVPLACFGRGALESGQRCLSFLEQGGVLALQGGESLVVGARARPYCPGAYQRVSGFALPGPPEAVGFAIWPADRLEDVKAPAKGLPWKPTACKGWCSFGRAGHPRVRVSAGQRARLEAAARAAGLPPDAGPLEVLQEYSLDLDNDGEAERFFSVAAPDPGAEGYIFRFSALIMDRGRGRPMLVRRDDRAAVVLRGSLDLDRDGRRELWLLYTPTEGDGIVHEVVRVGTEEAVVIGGYRCQPR